MNHNDLFECGMELGAAAFELGIPCAPALDSLFRGTAKGLSHEKFKELAKGWHRGWTKANVESPF